MGNGKYAVLCKIYEKVQDGKENIMIIKTCPHCGGTANLRISYSHKMQAYFVYVKCEICGAQGKAYTDEEDPEVKGAENSACQFAISAWNMRYGVKDEQDRL